MKIIDRYIFKELFKIFSISVGFLTLLLFMDKILYLTELMVNKGVTAYEVGKMMVYICPAFLALTIPISVLVSPVVVFNQFSADNEWVAMKSNGWSFIRLMLPVLYFSIVAYLITNLIMFLALPWGNRSFKELVYDIVQTRASLEIKPNIFSQDFKNLVVLVRDKEGESTLKDVFIADTTSSQDPKIIVADEGVIITNHEQLKIQLQLKRGIIHELGEQKQNYQMLNFDRYDLTLDLPNTDHLQKRALLGNRELAMGELLEKIRTIRLAGGTSYPEEVELSKKFSLPFTCLIFGFIGAPLGIKSSRSGKSGSYTVATVTIALYYIVFISTQNLGSLGKINSYFSVWIPNIIFTGMMIYLDFKMQREIPFRWITWAEDWVEIAVQGARNLFVRMAVRNSPVTSGAPGVTANRNELEYIKKQILRKKLKEAQSSGDN